MRRVMLTLLAAAVLAAGGRAGACPTAGVTSGPQARLEVRQALAPVEAAYAASLQPFEPSSPPEAKGMEGALDALLSGRLEDRARVLGPLAAQGNVEAMTRLAYDLRDDDAPAAADRWLSLISCAARHGQADAVDELVRWTWHQRDDGSMAAIQAYRGRALDLAARNAEAGEVRSLRRLAVYIAGDVHQYPAAPHLAARLTQLAAGGPWRRHQTEWSGLRAEILDHGRSSAGEPTDCTTATPWCRIASRR